MINDSNQKPYAEKEKAVGGASKVIGLSLLSTASAIAGGVAVAWWYRKTLSKLHNPISKEEGNLPESHNLEPK